ncbi:General transcription factor II-I repeat domain-containing protein 2A [Eumeta japonica]|uniref:General transcription factor II-I repeat domain-containing protein 2A n=1 Tax=Eumeta variegata TaxID=151549 RepID=A0A4C1YZ32_EUMVA|nr:General transcription factor II-I repeat domain-containing protein 2A [Eumeta japonica]
MLIEKFVLQLLSAAVFVECSTALDDIYHAPSALTLKPDVQLPEDSLFGFSIAYLKYLEPRLVVGAPRADHIGRVYECSLEEKNSSCVPIDIPTNDIFGLSTDHGVWLGASVTAGSSFYIVCAPRCFDVYKSKGKRKGRKGIFGLCFKGGRHERLQPLQRMTASDRELSSQPQHLFESSVDELGWSSHVTRNDLLVVGGPPMGKGTVVVYFSPLDLRKSPNLLTKDYISKYNLGYSVTSGNFFSNNINDELLAISSTYGFDGTGKRAPCAPQVLLMSKNTTVVSTIQGGYSNLGAMFGAALCTANLEGDGRAELVVGAPAYSAGVHRTDTGAVYIYRREGASMILLKKINGTNANDYFGYAMVNVGDVDKDGYDVSESSGGPLPLPLFHQPDPLPLGILLPSIFLRGRQRTGDFSGVSSEHTLPIMQLGKMLREPKSKKSKPVHKTWALPRRDVAISAPGADGGVGAVFVYSNRALTGAAASSPLQRLTPAAGLRGFGLALSALDDYDNNGCKEKKNEFEKNSLSRRTVVGRIVMMANDIQSTLIDRMAGFESFSIALDKSTDFSHTTQLDIFIRDFDKEFTVTEELLDLHPLRGTVVVPFGEEFFNKIRKVFTSFGLPWSKLVGVCIDSVPSMIGLQLAVGAADSNHVLVYRCFSILTVQLQPQFPNLRALSLNATSFSFNSCVIVTYPEKPIVISAAIQITVEIIHRAARLADEFNSNGAYQYIRFLNANSSTDRTYNDCVTLVVDTDVNGDFSEMLQYKISLKQMDNPCLKKDFQVSRVLIPPQSIQDNLPAVRECKLNVCQPQLHLDPYWSMPSRIDRDTYMLGSTKREHFMLNVTNTGDTSYGACVRVRVSGVPVWSPPAHCDAHAHTSANNQNTYSFRTSSRPTAAMRSELLAAHPDCSTNEAVHTRDRVGYVNRKGVQSVVYARRQQVADVRPGVAPRNACQHIPQQRVATRGAPGARGAARGDASGFRVGSSEGLRRACQG